MKLITIESANPTEWSRSLNAFHYSLFISTEWIQSLATVNRIPVYLNFMQNDQIVGKIAGLIIKEKLFINNVLYFYSGPALKCRDHDLYDDCIRALVQYSIETRYCRLIVRSYDHKVETENKVDGFFNSYRVEYAVRLKDNNPEKDFHCGFLKNVKKAGKKNTIICSDSSERMVNVLLNLLGTTYKIRLTKGHKKYNFLYVPFFDESSLMKVIKSGLGKIYYTLNDGEIHCIQLNLEIDDQSYALFMGVDSYGYQNGMPSFMDFSLIKLLRDKGFNYYNLGGLPAGKDSDGISYYKMSQGAHKIMITGGSTNFLKFPQKILNPLMAVGRALPKHNFFKFMSRILES